MANKFKYAGSSQMSPIENTVRKEIVVKSEASRIIEIAFLDGESTAKKASVQQYVNINRSDRFVEGKVVPNSDRLGNKPRLKVSFSKPGAHQFTVKCRPHAENSRYTDGELARNSRCTYQKEQKAYTTENDGSLVLPIDDFFVSPAGRDKFVFEATDSGGQTVSTGNLEVMRLIYYIELKMRSLTSCANNLSIVEQEYAKHNIKLVKLPAVEMEYIPNIGRGEGAKLLQKAEKAYASSKAIEKQPYVIAIAYTSHLAVKKQNHRIIEPSIKVGPGCAPVVIDIVGEAASSDSPVDFYLWQGLNDDNWFVSARYLKEGGTRADLIQISQDKCTPVLEKASHIKAARTVSIDVSTLPPSTGTIELIVDTVEYMRAGVAFEGMNMVCVCTEVWWKPVDERDQNKTIIHELGHKIGMVPDGRRTNLDKPSTWYDDAKGHFGNHCFNGLSPNLPRYDGDVDDSKVKCVMFGAMTDKSAFCANCAPIVCKADLSDGWDPL